MATDLTTCPPLLITLGILSGQEESWYDPADSRLRNQELTQQQITNIYKDRVRLFTATGQYQAQTLKGYVSH